MRCCSRRSRRSRSSLAFASASRRTRNWNICWRSRSAASLSLAFTCFGRSILRSAGRRKTPIDRPIPRETAACPAKPARRLGIEMSEEDGVDTIAATGSAGTESTAPRSTTFGIAPSRCCRRRTAETLGIDVITGAVLIVAIAGTAAIGQATDCKFATDRASDVGSASSPPPTAAWATSLITPTDRSGAAIDSAGTVVMATSNGAARSSTRSISAIPATAASCACRSCSSSSAASPARLLS